MTFTTSRTIRAGKNNVRSGFALPTILIASLVMLSVMLMAVQANASTSAALMAQYYNKLASEASESGAAMAQGCLATNSYVATWSNAKPLAPNTDCYGNVQSGPATVLSDGDIQTTFTVPAPTVSNGSQVVSVNGVVNLLRTSSGVVWKSYKQSTASQVGAQESFANVAFGYVNSASFTSGAYFATKDANGNILSTGDDAQGQLGNNTTSNAATQTRFNLPTGVVARNVYTNFLSQGFAMFVTGSNGLLYGAGMNDAGQLGNNITLPVAAGTTQSAPQVFTLPGGVTANNVNILRYDTVVIGSDNKVYVSGGCTHGLLGYTYTISGCSDRPYAMPITFPSASFDTTPALQDGSVPVNNMVTDRESVIMRTQGGGVFGWGENDAGQLANNTSVDASAPVQIGQYGVTGQPKATQVAFDGETTYILDDSGNVMASGRNDLGQLAGGASPLVNGASSMCLENPGNSSATGTVLELNTCSTTTSAAQQLTFVPDGSGTGTLQFHPTSSVTLCVDSGGGAQYTAVKTASCNGSTSQQWDMRFIVGGSTSSWSLYNYAAGTCIDDPGASTTPGVNLRMYQCNGTVAQRYAGGNQLSLSKVQLPTTDTKGGAVGKVTKIVTDQWSILFLTSTGEVWGAGFNDMGQLGNGITAAVTVRPTQMIIPAGRKAVEIYTTKSGGTGSPYSNTFVILDDGSVWGCGDDSFGQLGNKSTSATPVTTPVQMSLPTGKIAKEVESGYGTTIVLTTDGTIYTVGNNSNGQLGDGTLNNSSTPVANKYTNIIPTRMY